MKTVDEFILELQSMSKTLRSKPVVIAAANGLHFEPKCKRLIDLDKGQTIFDNFSDTEKMIITYD